MEKKVDFDVLHERPVLYNLHEWSEAIYAINVSKGFWESARPIEEGLILAAGELNEALECVRNNANFSSPVEVNFRLLIQYLKDISDNPEKFVNIGSDVSTIEVLNFFKSNVKDTFGDELADTVIRLLDCLHGFNLWSMIGNDASVETELLEKSIPVDLFYIQKMIYNSTTDPVLLVKAILQIYAIANCYEVQLDNHIKAKVQYNRTRPHKHGKQF